ncbi:MAG: hypothetical protein AB1810_06600 [Pseudomonadota bacterium]
MSFDRLLSLLLCGWLGCATCAASAEGQAAPGAAPPQTDAAAELMTQARQAMKEAQYNIAIKAYTAVAGMPDNAYRQDALELLGLAYESNAQIAQAKATYREYLQRYPEGEGYERVRQRLAGLETAAWDAPKKLRVLEKADDLKTWQLDGSFYQELRRDASRFENQDEQVHQFSLDTGVELYGRRRTDRYDIKTRFSGDYLHDFDDSARSEFALSYLYLDVNPRGTGWAGRVGRQRANSGGVLGRFDGINIGWHEKSAYTVNLIAGMPVERTTESPDSSRYFYGVNMQTGPWAEYWELNGYFIEQQADGFLDRRAVGGELRYLHPRRSLFTLVDYDVSYSQLNIFNTQLSVTLKDKTTLSGMFDYRNAPPITTRNALIGQSAESLDELNTVYTEDEIRQLARDRTPHNYMATVSITHPLNERWRISADFTGVNLTATTASGGVPANPGTPDEFYLSGRLTASDWFKKGDFTLFGARLTDTANDNAFSLTFNCRLPLASGWRVDPRMQLEYRKYNDSDDTQLLLAPGVRLDYRWNKRYTFEFESGIEWSRRTVWFETQQNTAYYLTLGYRVDF